MPLDIQILGKGIYTPREAARLVGMTPQDIRRWTRGSGATEPLWHAYYQELDDSCEISFLDLIEVRVVASLREAGVSLQAIRFAIDFAEQEYQIDRPLASLQFKTDGKDVLINALEDDGELTSLSKKNPGQKVFKQIVQQSLKDLEFKNNRPINWRPNNSREIIIDPKRAFGDPILDEFGVSTKVLNAEFEIFSDIGYLANIYEIPKKSVKHAINFERKMDGQRII